MAKIKVTQGNISENNTVKAIIPAATEGAPKRTAFNHRHLAAIDTGLSVVVPKGHRLCFKVVPELGNQGLLAVNSPGNLEGECENIKISLLNAARAIVNVEDGMDIVQLWLEKIVKLEVE